VTSTRLYGGHAHATKLYGDFFPLFNYQTAWGSNQPTRWWRRLLLLLSSTPTKTDLFKYYYYTLITILHSPRLRPLLLQTPQHDFHLFPAQREIFSPWREIFSLITVGNTLQFQISRRRGGSHVTWEVERVILIWKKSLPPPEQTSTYYTKDKPRNQILLATVIVEVQNKFGQYLPCRALLDSASQSHFLTEKCVQLLR